MDGWCGWTGGWVMGGVDGRAVWMMDGEGEWMGGVDGRVGE